MVVGFGTGENPSERVSAEMREGGKEERRKERRERREGGREERKV